MLLAAWHGAAAKVTSVRRVISLDTQGRIAREGSEDSSVCSGFFLRLVCLASVVRWTTPRTAFPTLGAPRAHAGVHVVVQGREAERVRSSSPALPDANAAGPLGRRSGTTRL